MTSTDQRRARAAAIKTAVRYGLSPTRVQLLSDSNNTVMLLEPYPIVAKVATGHHRRLQLELDVANHIRSRNGPVVPPTLCPPARVHLCDNLQMSFWRFVEPDPDDAEPVAIAHALHDLHSNLDGYDGWLPSFDVELNSVSTVLADQHRAESLAPADRSLLQRALRQLREDLLNRTRTVRPLHGSPSTGNLIHAEGRVRFMDFETASVGPLEWDLAHLSDEVVAHYPSEFDEEVLHFCRALVSVKTATWCWANYAHPDLKWHAQHHLQVMRTWRSRDHEAAQQR